MPLIRGLQGWTTTLWARDVLGRGADCDCSPNQFVVIPDKSSSHLDSCSSSVATQEQDNLEHTEAISSFVDYLHLFPPLPEQETRRDCFHASGGPNTLIRYRQT